MFIVRHENSAGISTLLESYFMYQPLKILITRNILLFFQTQISKSQDDDIRILFRPILTQIVYIRLLNFRGQFLIA